MSTICILVFSHKQALSPEYLCSGCFPGSMVPAGRTTQPPCPPPGQACVGVEMQDWLGGDKGQRAARKAAKAGMGQRWTVRAALYSRCRCLSDGRGQAQHQHREAGERALFTPAWSSICSCQGSTHPAVGSGVPLV